MITQNNKNKSDIRKKLTNILGLTETEEKLTVKNSERILGSQGAFYFGNNPQTGETDGCGCGNHPQNPNGDGDGDGDGGGGDGQGDGGGGDDNPYECECVEILDTLKNPCCVSGKDCDTGQGLNLRFKGGGGMDCPTPPQPDWSDTVVITWVEYTGVSSPSITHFELGTVDAAAALCEEFRNKSVESFRSKVTSCGSVSNVECSTYATLPNGEKYCYETEFKTDQCGYFHTITNVILHPSEHQYNAALDSWKKRQTAQYYSENGKIYNACDPYGEPPQDCIDMCDSKGNKYRVCGNGNITKLS